MTNYDKWDQYVATLALSSDEEEAADVLAQTTPVEKSSNAYGWGKPLDARGQIDRTGDLTVGNAKGNALSTNKVPQKVNNLSFSLILSSSSYHPRFFL